MKEHGEEREREREREENTATTLLYSGKFNPATMTAGHYSDGRYSD